MKATDAVELLEPHHIAHDPGAPALLAAVLSLFVPGLGQALLGQYSRGMRLFAASATLCFGLGTANLVVAYDAYSVACRKREGDISAHTSSKSLWVFTMLWTGFCHVLDGIIDATPVGPGPSFVITVPLMLLSYLAGGKGFRR